MIILAIFKETKTVSVCACVCLCVQYITQQTHRKSVICERGTNFILLVQLLFATDHVLDKVQCLQHTWHV